MCEDMVQTTRTFEKIMMKAFAGEKAGIGSCSWPAATSCVAASTAEMVARGCNGRRQRSIPSQGWGKQHSDEEGQAEESAGCALEEGSTIVGAATARDEASGARATAGRATGAAVNAEAPATRSATRKESFAIL